MTDLRNEARETERAMQSAPQDLLDKVSFGISIMQSKEIRQNPLGNVQKRSKPSHESGFLASYCVFCTVFRRVFVNRVQVSHSTAVG